MKRPGWLGGGDGDDGPRERKRRTGDGEAREPASERSERRRREREERAAAGAEPQTGSGPKGDDVRKRLGDRVGGPDRAGPGDEQRRKPRAERKRTGRDRGKDAAAAERERKDESGTDEPAKPKLNRPRRQPATTSASARSEKPGAAAKPARGEGSGKAKREGAGDRARDREQKVREDERKDGERERKDGSGSRSEGRRDRERSRRDRSRRRGAGKRVRAGAAASATALKRGAIETGRWSASAAPKAGRKLLSGLAAAFAVFFAVLGFLLGLLFAAWRRISGPVGTALRAADRAIRAVSRRVTPVRVLTVVVAGAAVLLALSQYADYRSISIGNGAYADVQSLAPAPETGRAQTGDPHSYVFVPVAIACLLLLAVATIGKRWRACRLISLAGFAAIVVALIVDRPAGLDPGDAAIAFEGAKAKLIGGFYAQIAAGVLLIGSSSMLAREIRLATVTGRAPARSRPAVERAGGPKLRSGTARSRGPARA